MFEIARRGHLRRLWLYDPTGLSALPYWVDPTQVFSVKPLAIHSGVALELWECSTIRLRGAFVPVDVLGQPDLVFHLLELGDPNTEKWQR